MLAVIINASAMLLVGYPSTDFSRQESSHRCELAKRHVDGGRCLSAVRIVHKHTGSENHPVDSPENQGLFAVKPTHRQIESESRDSFRRAAALELKRPYSMDAVYFVECTGL